MGEPREGECRMTGAHIIPDWDQESRRQLERIARMREDRECDPTCAPHLFQFCSLECELRHKREEGSAA